VALYLGSDSCTLNQADKRVSLFSLVARDFADIKNDLSDPGNFFFPVLTYVSSCLLKQKLARNLKYVPSTQH
jgi:hypothetical protein